jgi:hypothetical protein
MASNYNRIIQEVQQQKKTPCNGVILNAKDALMTPFRCEGELSMLALASVLPGKTPTTRNPEKGREATAPSFIKEIQEVQGGQEVPHDGGTIIPEDG